MTPLFSLTIPGPPRGKILEAKAFFSKKMGRWIGQVHTSTRKPKSGGLSSARWIRRCADMAQAAWLGTMQPTIDEPVRVDIVAVSQRPQRLCRKKDPPGRIWCGAKPDPDNISKAVCSYRKILIPYVLMANISFWAFGRQLPNVSSDNSLQVEINFSEYPQWKASKNIPKQNIGFNFSNPPIYHKYSFYDPWVGFNTLQRPQSIHISFCCFPNIISDDQSDYGIDDLSICSCGTRF